MFIHIDKFMGEHGGTRTRSNPLHGSLLHAVQGLKRAPATNRIWTRAPASANFSSPFIGLGFTLHRLVSSFTGGSPFRLRAPHELAACCATSHCKKIGRQGVAKPFPCSTKLSYTSIH